MKTTFLFLLTILMSGFEAQASVLICTAGQRGMDDRIELRITNTTIDLNRHESYLTASTSTALKNGNSIALLDQKVSISAEGQDSTATVSALMVFDPKNETMNVTLVVDGKTQLAAVELHCQ